MNFSESLLIPKTEQKLADHWAYDYVKALAEYGLIAGGMENDFKLDYTASQELFTVLLRNTIIKMTPDFYNLDLDKTLKNYELQEELTGEMAGTIILEILDVPYEKGKALETVMREKVLPGGLSNHLKPKEPVTMDVVYGLTVETVKNISH